MEILDAGFHEVNFNASNLSSGIYSIEFQHKVYIMWKNFYWWNNSRLHKVYVITRKNIQKGGKNKLLKIFCQTIGASMKRSYCTFICVLTVLFLNIAICYAQNVSISDAQKVAKNFLLNYQTANKNKLPSVQSAAIYKQQVIQSDKGEEIAYVFEMAPEGFIVTSTDNNITPILAYSFNGKFSYDENEENHLLHMIRKDLELRNSDTIRIRQ